MKNFTFLLVFSCLFQNMFAQFNYMSEYENIEKYQVVDTAYLKCSFKLTWLKSTDYPDRPATDLQILLIGKKVSKCYSQYLVDYNHFVVAHLKKGHDTYPNIKEKGAWHYEVFKNYPQGKVTITDIASDLQGNFQYEEDFPVFNWNISEEKQTILSYPCQKATASFRGRKYIAWYATNLPIPNGPWKFGDLPGLILKVSDSDNNFIWECQGIEKPKSTETIKYYQVEYTKTTRKDLAKTYQRFHDDIVPYLHSIGRETMGGKSLKIPYNPIELE